MTFTDSSTKGWLADAVESESREAGLWRCSDLPSFRVFSGHSGIQVEPLHDAPITV